MVSPLQDTTTGQKAAEQHRHQDTAKRILPREKDNQDATVTISSRERLAGAALTPCNLNHRVKPGSRSAEKAGDDNRWTHRQTSKSGARDVAANHTNLKTKC